MQRGEIWWADLPPPHRRRPILLLSRNGVYGSRGFATVAPITTKRRNLPTWIPIGGAEGLHQESSIDLDSMFTADVRDFERVIGSLSPEKFAAVEDAIRFALDLPQFAR